MDQYLERLMIEQRLNDKSFQERENFFTLISGGISYKQHEVREIWFRGISHGIEIGLRNASLDGQKIELNNNTTNERHKEFIEKLYELSEEYKCAVQYHPELGMVIVDRNNREL